MPSSFRYRMASVVYMLSIRTGTLTGEVAAWILSEYEAYSGDPAGDIALCKLRLFAPPQRNPIVRQRVAAPVYDEKCAPAAQHLRVHTRDRTVGVIQHQQVGAGTANAATGVVKLSCESAGTSFSTHADDRNFHYSINSKSRNPKNQLCQSPKSRFP